MKETMTWTECLERRDWVLWKVLPTALIWALSLLSPSEWLAQNVSSVDEGAKVTEVMQPWTRLDEERTITLGDAIQSMCNESEEINQKGRQWDESLSKAPTKFTVSTWVGYTVGWDVKWVNRIQWSGEVFHWTKWATKITWIVDLDDPMHSKWSWKLILWKNIYKWISLDWDYTFTWTGWNIFRFGLWYGGKIWQWVYWIKLFPLNTNWSPIAVKVFTWSKLWKGWEISSFMVIDLGKQSYYWETEYTQKLVEWIALFLQARLWWTLDGRFWAWDSQNILWWVRIDIK